MLIVWTTRSARGSIRETLPSSAFATQTAPAPVGDPGRGAADDQGLIDMRTVRINPGDRAIRPVGHPDAARASGDPGRRGTDGHAGRDLAGDRVKRAGAVQA